MDKKGEGDRPFAPLAAVLSYLVPGLGQIMQGRVGKGLLFMVSLLGMFTLGQAMGNWQNVYLPPVDRLFVGRDVNEPISLRERVSRMVESVKLRWHFAGQFWIGAAAWPAILQFNEVALPGASEEKPFWRDFQRAPTDIQINDFLRRTDKSPDLGWVYTVVAGVLNLLVIYDALAGPAHGKGYPKAEPESPDMRGRTA